MIETIQILEKEDVKVLHLQRFEALQKTMPKQLRDFMESIKDKDTETLEIEWLRLKGSETFYPQCTNYLLKVVNIFTSETLTDENVGFSELESLYFHSLSLLNTERGQEIESFTFNNVEYFLPKPALVGEEIGLFLQVQNLAKDPITNLNHIVAHLCRPEGEGYDYQVSIKRAESFRQLPLQIALSVSFFLQKLLVLYSKRLKNSITETTLKKITALQKSL